VSKLQIYKASAGSGKTYLLTLTYLKSAFKNPKNFSKILAVTFTNKAAEEMKTRILDKLNDLIIKGKNADYYSEILKTSNLKDVISVQNRAKLIQEQILHNYSAFHVNTIDSFVQQIIRAFTFEMGLNSSYDIELDRNKVIDDLTEMLYASVSENKDLQKWLIQFADSKTRENKNWDFKNNIKKLAEELFKERFQELYASDTQKFDKSELSDYLKELYKIKNNFETQMSAFAEQYKTVIENAGIDSEAYGRNFKTISNHFLKKIAEEKKYDDFTAAIVNAREGIENWYAKSASAEIISDIKMLYPKLSVITENYFRLFETEHENYYTAQEIIANFHAFGIINDLAGFLPDYRNENNILLISDTTLLLKEIIGNNDAPFIYEKTGNRFQHILIDEFQDTSGFQWENFKPLILNSLSQGFNNLIVGDIKQSIYRWRSGDWKLLLSGVKNDIGSNFIEDKTLDSNWRSLENIILFNNTVFEIIPQILQNQYNSKLEEINNSDVKETLKKQHYDRMLIDAYSEQKQKIPENADKKGGKVKIYFSESKEYTEYLHEKFPEVINNMLLHENKSANNIGILVRTNKQAKEITELLTHYQNESSERAKYKIISGESLYIENSSAVRVLISSMKYINNPTDTINLAQLIYEYQKLSNETENINVVFLSLKDETYKQFLPKKFISEFNDFSQKELFELSEELISIFNLSDKTEEFAYIKTFQNTITEFTRRRYSDLSEFIDWWEEKGINTSVQISDKTNAVTVMTIHKSKGLSFKTVMVPYTNFNFDYNSFNAPILWAKAENMPFNRFAYLPIKYSGKLTKTIFRKDYFDEMLYTYIDAVNLLYVAFTRAENELTIFSSFSKSRKNKNANFFNNTGDLLYKIVSQTVNPNTEEQGRTLNFAEFYDEKTGIFDFSVNYDLPEKETEEFSESSEFVENKYPNNHWKNKLRLKYNSEDFMIESIPEIEEKVNYGKLMHLIFQNITTHKDIDKAVMMQYHEGLLSSEEAETLKEEIRKIISDDKVKFWFDGTYKVLNEDALLTEKGNIRIPDRVLFSEKEIIVIDFKFGEHHEKYLIQILEYKELLEDIYKKNVHAYLFYPKKNKIIEAK